MGHGHHRFQRMGIPRPPTVLDVGGPPSLVEKMARATGVVRFVTFVVTFVAYTRRSCLQTLLIIAVVDCGVG